VAINGDAFSQHCCKKTRVAHILTRCAMIQTSVTKQHNILKSENISPRPYKKKMTFDHKISQCAAVHGNITICWLLVLLSLVQYVCYRVSHYISRTEQSR